MSVNVEIPIKTVVEKIKKFEHRRHGGYTNCSATGVKKYEIQIENFRYSHNTEYLQVQYSARGERSKSIES